MLIVKYNGLKFEMVNSNMIDCQITSYPTSLISSIFDGSINLHVKGRAPGCAKVPLRRGQRWRFSTTQCLDRGMADGLRGGPPRFLVGTLF